MTSSSMLNHSAQVRAAQEFARIAHATQTRKWNGEPYFNHLREVHDIANQFFNLPEWALAVAWLHDVVEDTKTTYTDLARHGFMDEIIGGVWWLTDTHQNYGIRETRKKLI